MGAPKLATYLDLELLPSHQTGQIVAGMLHAHPRPAAPHLVAASALGEELGPPFRRGRGGPGGWVILDEPALHLGADVLVPDLAGWRREQLSADTLTGAYFTHSPNWVCEVLSPSTARLDRGPKLEVYRRENVAHVWLLDPVARTLEVLRLDGPTYRLMATYGDNERVRAEPFDAVELELENLWTM